ncbi:MAG TPA: hypothetical protein VHO06_13850 [Polyangia bacterium]|nr:hypothetical protein [Polyangia bacterium]
MTRSYQQLHRRLDAIIARRRSSLSEEQSVIKLTSSEMRIELRRCVGLGPDADDRTTMNAAIELAIAVGRPEYADEFRSLFRDYLEAT